jgi:hypothetical protein
MRAFSAACGLWLNGAFISAGFYKQKRAGVGRPFLLLPKKAYWIVICALRLGFLGQRQLEHAVLELGFRLGIVHFLRQREAAHDLAVDALAVQRTLVLRGFLLALDLRLDGHLRAVDRHVDVFLPHSGKLGAHEVGAILLGHVHLGAGKLHAALEAALEAERPDQKSLEQIVDQLVEWIVTGYIRHLSLLLP